MYFINDFFLFVSTLFNIIRYDKGWDCQGKTFSKWSLANVNFLFMTIFIFFNFKSYLYKLGFTKIIFSQLRHLSSLNYSKRLVTFDMKYFLWKDRSSQTLWNFSRSWIKVDLQYQELLISWFPMSVIKFLQS